MVTNALNIDNPVGFCNDSCIIAKYATIGSPINEGTTVSSAVLANVIRDVGVFWLDVAEMALRLQHG